MNRKLESAIVCIAALILIILAFYVGQSCGFIVCVIMGMWISDLFDNRDSDGFDS
jgi:hypothetical protein